MKYLALPLLALMSLPFSATAESSVTLYGVIDAGFRRLNDGNDHHSEIASGGIAASRFGLRGTEDLGGGMQAGFVLENQFSADTGASPAKLFSRRSTVSLSGGAGEVRLGRDFTPTYRVATLIADPFGNSGLAAVDAIWSTATVNGAAYATHSRVDNSITYFLPEQLGGLYGQATYAAGEGLAGNAYNGGLLGYKNKAVDAALAQGQTRIVDDWLKESAAALSYDFDVVRVMGAWSRLTYRGATEDHVNIGISAPLGAGTLRASYGQSKGKGGTYLADGAVDKAQKVAVGYVYNLSKRTALYTNLAHVKNQGGASFKVFGTPTLTGSTGSTGFDVGIRHNF